MTWKSKVSAVLVLVILPVVIALWRSDIAAGFLYEY